MKAMPPLNPTESTQDPLITVIIAAYSSGRWDQLRAAVASVAGQAYANHEIVVAVDNNPDLMALAQRELAGVTVVANTGSPGAGGARNSGVAVAHGSIVAFLDDDAQAEPGWLEAIAAGMAQATVLGVGGTITPHWLTARPWWWPREFDWVVGCTFRGSPERPTRVRNVISANMAVRRELFDAVGGFRKDFGKVDAVSQPEETEFCIRAGDAFPDLGWWFLPQLRVRHDVPASRTTLAYFLRRCWLEGLGKADLAELHPGGTATSDERRYATVVLPTGVFLELASAPKNPDALGRAAMIVCGLVYTAAGYVTRRLFKRR